MILTETHSKAAEFTSPWFIRARCSHTDNYTWCRTLDPTGSYIGFFPNVCNVEINGWNSGVRDLENKSHTLRMTRREDSGSWAITEKSAHPWRLHHQASSIGMENYCFMH